jgi:4-hydroxy-4-methyl-2-oxoglutarate aldolase
MFWREVSLMNDKMSKRLTGKISAERVRMETVPRPPKGLVSGFDELGPDSSLVSDVLDSLGIVGAIPASTLKPTMCGKAIVGPATTVRNIPLSGTPSPHERAAVGFNAMAEMEAHNLAEKGDVVVIAGVEGLSNMGGISATIAKRQGVLGAIVRGGIRDVGESRAESFPLWASETTPVTGKWRIETVEINGEVDIFGIRVRPGDLVIADDTGVCVVPIERAQEVLDGCRKKKAIESARVDAVRQGAHIADLPTAS